MYKYGRYIGGLTINQILIYIAPHIIIIENISTILLVTNGNYCDYIIIIYRF